VRAAQGAAGRGHPPAPRRQRLHVVSHRCRAPGSTSFRALRAGAAQPASPAPPPAARLSACPARGPRTPPEQLARRADIAAQPAPQRRRQQLTQRRPPHAPLLLAPCATDSERWSPACCSAPSRRVAASFAPSSPRRRAVKCIRGERECIFGSPLSFNANCMFAMHALLEINLVRHCEFGEG
jgi:hypothetical protein